ncbi:MAG: ArsR/SmtB family transcription factor [Phycisphaerae bacterium]
MKTVARVPKVDLLFRAFSDRTRLRILHLLVGGELCVCEIVEVLGLSQPKVSRHLAYLRRAGLVMARREGLWMHYRLAPATGAFHGKLVACLGSCFEEVPELVRDAAKLGRRRGACADGDCCGT